MDNFSEKIIDVDGDGVGDMSHGDLSSFFLKSANPDAKIDRYNVADANDKISQQNVYAALDQISQKGDYYTGVNMSLSAETRYENVSNYGITPDNLKQNTQLIKNDLRGNLYGDIINKIEAITGQGTPLFTSSGNDIGIFDLYGFANGITNVAAIQRAGTEPEEYSKNSMVDMFFNGDLTFNPVLDKNGNFTGVDMDGDGKVDVTLKELSSGGNFFDNVKNYISGKGFSSVASPKALGALTREKSPEQIAAEKAAEKKAQQIANAKKIGIVNNAEELATKTGIVNSAEELAKKTGVVNNAEELAEKNGVVQQGKTPADAVIKKAPAPKPEPKQVRNNDLDGKKGDKLDSTAKKFNDDLDNFDID